MHKSIIVVIFLLLNLSIAFATPVFNLPPTFVMNEDQELRIDFSGYLTYSGNVAISSTNNDTLAVSINGLFADISSNHPNWYGQQTLTFTAVDDDASTNANCEIIVLPVNDAPQFNIPTQGFTFDEDTSFTIDFSDPNLDGNTNDSFINDVDNSLSQLSLNTTSNGRMQISINEFEVTFTPDENVYGTTNVYFTAFDGNETAIATALITINALNDEPICTLNPKINEQAIFTGDIATLNPGIFNDDKDIYGDIENRLNYNYQPNQSYNWQISSNGTQFFNIGSANSLGYLIRSTDSGKYLRCKVSHTDNGFGQPLAQNIVVYSDTILVGAPKFLYANGEYFNNSTVEESCIEDGQLILNITAIDDEGTSAFTFSNYGLTNGTLTENNTRINSDVYSLIYTPESNFNGQVNFAIEASDDTNTTSTLHFNINVEPVNDPPVINVAGIAIEYAEDDSVTYDFTNNLIDIDADELTLFFAENANIETVINGLSVTFKNKIENYYGNEFLELKVFDALNDSASVFIPVNVTAVNDAPTSEIIESIVIDEDSIYQLDLNLTVNDVDSENLNISAFGQNLSINIDENLLAEIIPNDNFSGNTMAVFEISDSTFTTVDTMFVEVTPINDTPVLNLPNAIMFDEDTEYIENFGQYCHDADGQQTFLTASESTNLDITIFGKDVRIKSKQENYNGSEEIIFSLTDEASRAIALDTLNIVIEAVNDAPVMLDLNPVSFDEDNEITVDYSSYVSDVDGHTQTLQVNGNTNIEYYIDQRRITFSAVENFYGLEVLTITTTDGVLSDSKNVAVTVNPINDSPVITDIDDISIDQGASHSVDLNNYVSDVDTNNLNMAVSGNNNIEVTISGMMLNIKAPDNWFGSENINLIVSDGEFSIQKQFRVNVNEVVLPPSITLPNQLTLDEDVDTTIDLTEYINKAGMQLTVSQSNFIQTEITGYSIKFMPTDDWNGTVNLNFVVYDGQNSANQYTDVVVNAINDAPVYSSLQNPTVKQFDSVQITLIASDIDNNINQLTHTAKFDADPDNFTIQNSVFSWIPNGDFLGQYPVTFYVSDGQLQDSLTVNITVEPIVDTQKPVFTNYTTPQRLVNGIEESITVSFEATDNVKVTAGKVFYKPANSLSSYTAITMTENKDIYSAIITKDVFDEAGLIYYFQAEDASGNVAKSYKNYCSLYYPSLGLKPNNLHFGKTQNDYRLFSVPLTLDAPNAYDVLGDDTGSYGTNWRLLQHTKNELLELGDSLSTGGYTLDSLEIGKSYWLIVSDSVLVDTGSGETYPDSVFTLKLYKGWNSIGNPYTADLLWSNIKAYNTTEISSLLNDSLFVWQGNGWQKSDSLKTFSGGFVYTPLDLDIKVPGPGVNIEIENIRSKNYPENEIAIYFETNKTKRKAIAGFSLNAKNSFDIFDEACPPDFLNSYTFSFKNNHETNLSKSIKKQADEIIWDFAEIKQNGTLTFDKNANNYWIFDETNGINYDLAKTTKIKVRKGTKLKLVYAKNGNIENIVSPANVKLFQNSPNPFNPNTSIKFNLSTKQNVALKIYNVKGQVVKTLVNNKLNKGFYKINWNGKNNKNQNVASGVYFYKLTAGKQKLTKKMILLK